MLMAEAQEATGDRAAALDTYARAATAAGSPKEKAFGLLGQGRLLVADGKWDEARGRFEQALDAGDGAGGRRGRLPARRGIPRRPARRRKPRTCT